MNKILIIDTKAGNLFSLQSAIERLGYHTVVLEKPNDAQFDGIIIPGQGRFGSVLNHMRRNGWVQYLDRAREQTQPILGICVGMQIFFESSEEDQGVKGLGWFKGKVQALNFPKVPMIGWSPLTSTLWPKSPVYFINSFAIKSSTASIATTAYGETFCAAVRYKNFTGVQFHPEKSSNAGRYIIQNALTTSSVSR